MPNPTHQDTITRLPVATRFLLPERYALGTLLASGGQGLVHRAVDLTTGADVVVKIVTIETTAHAARFAREAGVLRALDLPHVVRLLDSGIDANRGWIVLEYAPGRPFPAGRTTWTALRPTVLALLETLAQLHDRGLVHRDLKPGNVLVDEAGSPTVLDFGLVRGEPAGPSITHTGMVMGTPRYMAPEQIRGERAGPRADLYALGLMVREALTGQVPHLHDDVGRMFDARLRLDAPPIRTQLPDLDPDVAAALDTMLARRIEDRPPSARDVLHRLAGSATTTRSRWLGPRLLVDEVMRRLDRQERVALWGARGSGRTRVLQEVEAALGRPALWLGPGAGPAASLVALIGPPAPGVDPIADLSDHLQGLLDSGAVLLVDDAERVDAWSRRVLGRLRGPMVVVEDVPGALVVPALSEEDLAPIFAGPERILHLRSDPARALWRRTGGSPARVVAELDHWVAAGIARWEDGLLRLDRAAVERIEAGYLGPPVEVTGDTTLPDDLDDLLAWVHLAGPDCSVDRLAVARAEPRWQVELAVQELAARGAVAWLGAHVEPVKAARALLSWHSDSRLAAHAALAAALPPGSPGRVPHLVALGDAEGLVDEALIVAARQVDDGRLVLALATLREAAHAALLARQPAPRLWQALIDAAFLDGSRAALATTHDLLRRAAAAGPLQHLSAAYLDLLSGHRARAVAAAAEIPANHAAGWAAWELRVQIARGEGGARHESVVRAAAEWARADGGPDALAASANWRSSLAYVQNRSAEAAEIAQDGAAATANLTRRLRLTLRAMSCWLEVGHVERVRALGAELRELGHERRLPAMEAYGEWADRTLAVRLREPVPVDAELVDAAGALSTPELAGLVWVTEAVLALRGGDAGAAASLAHRAAGSFREAGQPASVAWARAVGAAAAGTAAQAEEVAAELVATGRPDIVAEGLALLARHVGLDERWRGDLERAHAAADWGGRPDWPRGCLAPAEMVWPG